MTNKDELRRRLIEANGLSDEDARSHRRSGMRSLLDHENDRVRHLQRLSFTFWVLALLLPMGLLASFYVNALLYYQKEGLAAAIHLVSPVLVTLGAVFLVIAIVLTVSCFFRQRTASLAAIEARLAGLERQLQGGSERVGDK